jgi:hypothetical protein
VTERIAQLSLAAIRMAASGPRTEHSALAQWLYRFGTLPRGPAVERDFGLDDEPMAVLGMAVGDVARRRLETKYIAASGPGWVSFAGASTASPGAAACKLYVSPRPEALADAFPRIADTFVRCDVRSFKVGRGIEGLLRPDKIVAYFDDRAHMENVASSLARALRRCPAHGVPFTADLGADGLLSFGKDPPADDPSPSWRAWVTTRLAASLTKWRAMPDVDPVAATLDDMRAAGVDPDRWLPNGI